MADAGFLSIICTIEYIIKIRLFILFFVFSKYLLNNKLY
jgi:hypothetical protein